ncbi:lipase 1-like [Galleria mellonella]|uniref:Lipase n=1 Tax=Galleria mellonella TaxID=7137 RepID=A0ABM3MDW6_GALME|nr:lipase 1-like [Galleria mellonella]
MLPLVKEKLIVIFVLPILCESSLVDPILSSAIENVIPNINITEIINKYSPLQSHLSEDGKLNFSELAVKYGQKCEEYSVTTEDKYILTIFHIPGKGRPVLLMHGLIDSSDTFIIRGNISLAITLADAGYDVWAANFRGNRYSLGHETLDCEKDKEYWDFSLYEFGYYDSSVCIDFVLQQTDKKKLTVIGHSQGTTNFFVLGSRRPEYNDKINVFIALAPVAYLSHMRGLIEVAVKLAPPIYSALTSLGVVDVFKENSALKDFIEVACTQDVGSYELCFDGAIFPGAGFDSEETEPQFSHVVFGHYPARSSIKNIYHLSQIANRNKFADYDYGTIKNLEVYGATDPPEFDLGKVKAKTALFVGENDFLGTVEDVDTLKSQLPNVVKYQILPRKEFNHMDFVWGKHMPETLYPYVFEVLDKYS